MIESIYPTVYAFVQGIEPSATLITGPGLEEQIRAQREAWGGDRYDEVWEGTYLMNPLPNPEHANLQARLTWAFQSALNSSPAMVYPGLNVSDRSDDWTKNYRCPDVAVVLPGGIARNATPTISAARILSLKS